MALIKLGGLAQDVRGSLNGTVFSRNKGGAYTRTKVSPVQPVSPYLSGTRQSFKIVSQAWAQSLTDAERAGWIAFAALHPFTNVFGDSIDLSGIAFFQAASKRLDQLGFPFFADAPAAWTVTPPGAIAPVVSVNGAGAISILVNPTTPPDNADIDAYLFTTKKIANGAQPQKNEFRLTNYRDGTVRDDSYDFGPAYKERFDPYLPNVGDKIALLYAYFDTTTGCLSVPSQATVITTGVPGPLIDISVYEWLDAGGGDANLVIDTLSPHGMSAGQTGTIASNSDGLDGARTINAVPTPQRIIYAQQAHAASGPAYTDGTVQRTA